MKQEIVVIPDYTAEQYLNTSEPYEFLYQYRENKFMLKQLLQKMKIQAGEVGVKCFVALFDAYCLSQAKQQGVCLENSTQFDGQELELFSGEYIADDFGVAVQDKYGFENVICRHPIMPVRRLVNVDSGEERLQIAYRKGRMWRSLIAEKSTIASSNKILDLASNGVLVTSENAKALSKYLLEIEDLNYDTIPEQKSVSRLGWVGDGFSPYVEDLVFDGENNFKHIFNSVRSHGDREKWIEAMSELRAEKGVARIALASSFASVLLQPCGLLSFFTHFWGGTEVGKSVLLLVAASVWASPEFGEYVTTFNSTLVGQEMTAAFLNSLPGCIDELQIQSSQGIKDFDKIIYQLAEGVGKTRGSKSGGLLKVNTWRNCFITNGEHPISNANSGGGAVNRIIEVEVTEKIHNDLPKLCGIIKANYGFAGREFVEYLQTDGAIERVSQIQKKYYKELLKSDSTEKQAGSASAILTADFIATELIFKDGNNLTVDDLSVIMTKKDDVCVNSRAYEYIQELIGRNPNKFRANDFGDYPGELWGKIETNEVYIIKSVFDREMSLAGFNSTAFLSWAKRNNLLLCDKNKRTKKTRVTPGGSALNCVCIVTNKENKEEIDEDFDDIPF